MRSSPMVKVEISTNRASRLTDGFVGSQMDLLVFDAAPQPFNEDVVPPGLFAVHADGDAVAGEDADKVAMRMLNPTSIRSLIERPLLALSLTHVDAQSLRVQEV